jgi:hypothetical protein
MNRIKRLPRLRNRPVLLIVFVTSAWLLLRLSVLAAGSDPLNVPLESLGVSGYDKTLCSDRWNTCSDYDRQQFDQRYPGRPLEELSLYPPARGSTEAYGSREKRHDFDKEYRPPSNFQGRDSSGRSRHW